MIIPKEITNLVNSNDKHKQYARTLQVLKGVPYFRLWCIQGKKFKECYRQTLDKCWINSDYIYTWCGGWNCYFNDTHTSYYYITARDVMLEFDRGGGKIYSMPYSTNNKRFTDFVDYELLREVEGLKYIVTEKIPIDSVPYLRKWREYPDLELYTKFGITYVASDRRFLILKGDKRKRFLTWFKNNLSDAKEFSPNYSTVLKLSKDQTSYKEYQKECDFEYYKNNINDLIPDEYKKATFEYLYKVCDENFRKYMSITIIGLYRDYIKACKELGRNILDHSVMFPKNIRDSHDQMTEKLTQVKNKIIDFKMEQVANLLKPVKNKNLQIIIPKSTSDLIDVSNKLHNCVGKMDYNLQMAKCEDVIILVCDLEGNYVECCELVPNETRYRIKQLYGEHNDYAENHEECEKLVKKFIANNNIVTADKLVQQVC